MKNIIYKSLIVVIDGHQVLMIKTLSITAPYDDGPESSHQLAAVVCPNSFYKLIHQVDILLH